MAGKRKILPSIIVVVVFAAAGFVLYYPVYRNTFLSDDYDSLYRIYIEKRIIYREFLRPMIDISFYFNYFLSGLSPVSYYIFNIVVHVINALLLCIFACRLNMVDKKKEFQFAVTAGFLFLIYPFHNESISWLSGRLSSMACLLALLSLLLSGKNGAIFTFLSIVCYLVGLLCYESIIVLPLIIIVVNFDKYRVQKKIVSCSLYWAGAACVYLLARLVLSGEITGDYGSRVTDNNFPQKVLNTVKVLGRLFFPPSENRVLLTGATVILFIFLLVMHRYLFKTKIFINTAYAGYRSVLICLAISLLIPFAFGVSTRTSEGDRLLYFPSAFLCILVASWIVVLCKEPLGRWLALTVIIVYCTWLLELNNQHWVKASGIAGTIMKVVKSETTRNIIFINMPDEVDGAFVFRNGFKRALMINHIDTARVKVFNYLERADYLKAGATISPVMNESALAIFPYTRISVEGEHFFRITGKNNEALTIEKERNLIYYWNKEKLIKIF